ncbi:hypothetical protein NGM10_15190 [Halorussus salilacus]|uniref:hypothetical protein n=1 Tax=Halorussus salilacus TaxID=2953750 RepID=UPI0020A01749|nr:hypothetical protein [Halorussus salilacus]USZ68065.1 hypothetical protein NGM10_15190 [Halorussus salilacus]
MSSQNTKKSFSNEGATIVLHRNNPDLPQSTCRELTQRGIGVVDFGMGTNLDPDDSDNAAETRSKNTLRRISAGGAYGAIHVKGLDIVVVGYAAPRAIRFFELENVDGEVRTYPGFQFERFGEVPEGGDGVFERLDTAIGNRTNKPTLYEPDEGTPDRPGIETIPEAFIELDRMGRLRRPIK